MLKKHWKKQNRRTHRFLIALLGITILGLALRIIFCFELQDAPAVYNPSDITDMETYERLARNILTGDWPEKFYYQPFYYSFFLPAAYFITGGANLGVALLQALLGGATVWLTGLTGSRLYGRKAGLIAAFVLALSKAHIFFTPFLLIAPLQTFWMILLAYTGISAWKTNSLRWWALTGIVLSVTALTRGNVILLLPALIMLAVWRNRKDHLKWIAACGIIIAITFIPRIPFALKNYEHYGYWTGASSAAGTVLALGNNPQAPPGGLLYTDAFEAWTSAAKGKKTEERISVTSQLWEWICQEPLAYAELKWQAFLLFWNQREIPNNVGYDDEGSKSLLLQQAFVLGFGTIGVLGFAGLLLGCTRIRRSPCIAYFHGLFILYMGSIILFYILTRFRAPIDPYLTLATGHFFVLAGKKIRRYKERTCQIKPRVVTIIGTTAAGIALVWAGFPAYNHLWESYVMNTARPYGVFIQTEDHKKLYDHGSKVFGEWQTIPIKQGKQYIQKSFSLPPQAKAANVLKQPALRLPLQVTEATRVSVDVRDEHGESLAHKNAYAKSSGLFWIPIPLEQIQVKNGEIFFTMNITVKTGAAGTVLDLQRDYDRTKIRQNADQPWQHAVGEAALELVWDTDEKP